MVTPAFQITHNLPGRVRVRLPRLKGNPVLAKQVEHTLRSLHGIRHVETSTMTGSALVLYEPFLLASLGSEAVGSLVALAPSLGLSSEDVDVDELQDWLHAMRQGTHAEVPTALAGGMAALGGSMDVSGRRVTEGWAALRTLVPLMLAFLGLRSLLVTSQLPFPTWYDYLWFAFSSYTVLNPSQQPSREVEHP